MLTLVIDASIPLLPCLKIQKYLDIFNKIIHTYSVHSSALELSKHIADSKGVEHRRNR